MAVPVSGEAKPLTGRRSRYNSDLERLEIELLLEGCSGITASISARTRTRRSDAGCGSGSRPKG